MVFGLHLPAVGTICRGLAGFIAGLDYGVALILQYVASGEKWTQSAGGLKTTTHLAGWGVI